MTDKIDRCEHLIATSETSRDDLERPLNRLKSNWSALKQIAEVRRLELDDTLNVANYLAEANEADAWIREKEQIVANETAVLASGGTSVDSIDEDAAEARLKRHSALMVDIEAFGKNSVYGDLRYYAEFISDFYTFLKLNCKFKNNITKEFG